MSSFRKPFTALRRGKAEFVKGEATLPTETAETIMASVQPSAQGDDGRVVQGIAGRETTDVFRIYTNADLRTMGDDEGYPGDILMFKGKRLLLVGKRDHNMMGSEVSHFRYLAIEEIEKGEGESPS